MGKFSTFVLAPHIFLFGPNRAGTVMWRRHRLSFLAGPRTRGSIQSKERKGQDMPPIYWSILLGLAGVTMIAVLAMIWRRLDGILKEIKQTRSRVIKLSVRYLPEITK